MPTVPVFQVPGPPGADNRGLNERWFESLCDNDVELQTLLTKLCASQSFTDKSLTKISKHLERIFATALDELAQIFYANLDLTSQYFLAKQSHRQTFGDGDVTNEVPSP